MTSSSWARSPGYTTPSSTTNNTCTTLVPPKTFRQRARSADMGKISEFLSPNNTGKESPNVTRHRSLNPFSRSRSADPDGAETPSSRTSSFSLSRVLSSSRRDSNHQTQQAEPTTRNPMLNPSPATRRPRPQSPPPAYSPNATAASGPTLGDAPAYQIYQGGAHPAISPQAASTAEDPYAFLSSFDTVLLIDNSGSMAGASWKQVKAVLQAIVPICTAHDEDGIDIYFINKPTNALPGFEMGSAGGFYRNVTNLAKVEDIFSTVKPGGDTMMGRRLKEILVPYTELYKQKERETGDKTCLRPLNIIVITDGEANDNVEESLGNAARFLDECGAPPYQIGVQFFQIGNVPGVAEYLQYLDDELGRNSRNGFRDMIDTVTFDCLPGDTAPTLTADGILKAVLGAVVKRLDRRPARASRT